MCQDLGTVGPEGAPAHAVTNAVWDGRQVRLFGARGEYVSFQLCIENLQPDALSAIQVQPRPLAGPEGARIELKDIELYRNWYARNRVGQWQPAYCVPLGPESALSIPDAEGRIPQQRNQTVYVDLYIPKGAPPGTYAGSMTVAAEQGMQVDVPVSVEVLDLAIPDRLSFWPELNAFSIPERAIEYYRLAHQHRCVLNCWAWRPQLEGQGAAARVIWNQYDQCVGPLLTGEAFADCRARACRSNACICPSRIAGPRP